MLTKAHNKNSQKQKNLKNPAGYDIRPEKPLTKAGLSCLAHWWGREEMLEEESISPSPPLNKSRSNAKRWRTATILGLWIALPCTLYFTACTHTVKWQQETLLNTGEMIVIDRKARFTYQQSGITNPLEYSLQPKKIDTFILNIKVSLIIITVSLICCL